MTDLKLVQAVKTHKPMRLIDIIVITAVAVLAVAVSLFALLGKNDGGSVSVTADGVTRTYALDTNREVKLDTMTVVIENGRVYVKGATCPDKLCQHTGKISRPNESIVCLPHGVIIRIEGSSEIDVDTGKESVV